MDFLIEHKNEIENRIAHQFLNLFDTSLKLCFYDITSTYFEAGKSITTDDIRKLKFLNPNYLISNKISKFKCQNYIFSKIRDCHEGTPV